MVPLIEEGRETTLAEATHPETFSWESIDIPHIPDETLSLSSDQLLGAYYEYFHISHPFVLPHRFLRQRNSDNFKALKLVMQFIGSLYHPSIPSTNLRNQVENELFQSSLPNNDFTVQALLLYSIALHWSDEISIAQDLIRQVTSRALQLGMHTQKFAQHHGDGDPVLTESWRRTWWQIYLTDAHLAAISRSPNLLTAGVDVTVDLPCEEDEYNSGVSDRSSNYVLGFS